MEALRDLADDFNVRDPRKLYRLARQRDLDVTQAMAFEALKANVGRQVQAPRRWASLLPRGRTTGCRPTSSTSARTPVPPAVHGALVDDEVGHQKLAMARHQQALRLQLVVLELLAELQEGPALQVHELVLSVRRALAGVQGLVASEGRVSLMRSGTRTSSCRRSSSKPVAERTLAPEVRLLQQGRRSRPDSKQLAISFTTS